MPGVRPARTAVPASQPVGPDAPAQSHTVEQLLLAGIGWLSLGAEAVDDLADELARRVGVERLDMRSALRDTIASWRSEAERLSGGTDEATSRLVAKLGLVRREELDDVELRLAQLEHRLRLLEPAPRL